MKLLAIETSCDETSAAVVESTNQDVVLLSQTTATSLALHSATGGIIPEVAAREQSKYIIPVIQETLKKAGLSFDKKNAPEIDAIAVTYGPGLIGSLLVGVETAKTLSFIWDKPLIPVNHLFGHIYANWLSVESMERSVLSPMQHAELPEFPLVALVVSGGHTDLVLMKSHSDITWLGGTRDDAAGECLDKSGRLLGFPYPAGPEIEKRAKLGNPKTYHFPRPLLHDNAFDFSFSGLKTAILREVERLGMQKERGESVINDVCRGLQDAIVDVLVTKTLQAAEKYNAKSILLSGGVAANQTLRENFEHYVIHRMRRFDEASTPGIPYARVFVPPKTLCTDNAAMIGAAAIFQGKAVAFDKVAANPELYFDE